MRVSNPFSQRVARTACPTLLPQLSLRGRTGRSTSLLGGSLRFCASTSKRGAVVGMYQNGLLSTSAKRIDESTGNALSKQLSLCTSMTGKVGDSLLVLGLGDDLHERIALVGLGEDPSNQPDVRRHDVVPVDGDDSESAKTRLEAESAKKRLEAERAVHVDARPDYADNVRMAACVGARLLRKEGAQSVAVDGMDHPQASAEGAFLGLYSFDNFKTKKEKSVALDLLEGSDDDASRWTKGRIVAESQIFARTLAEMPSNHMTPEIFAQTVKAELEGAPTLRIEVRDEAWARQQDMNCFLGVAQGSDNPLRFVEIHHNGGPTGEPPIVLVGKGVTFDSGGISLKPGKGMGMMRGDMGGAAAVAGAMRAVTKLGLKRNVIGLTPLCENMPSGKALKPGDVLRAKNGKTVEVDNTDAEGRLILADTLVYAHEFSPSVLIDVATLTGAMSMALGEQVTGVFTSDDQLYEDMRFAGTRAGERVWRMPLLPTYRPLINSSLADIINTGKVGAVSAAFFLKEFVETPHWMHMDIAGTAMTEAASGYIPKGMSGLPVRALLEYIQAKEGRGAAHSGDV